MDTLLLTCISAVFAKECGIHFKNVVITLQNLQKKKLLITGFSTSHKNALYECLFELFKEVIVLYSWGTVVFCN